MNRLDGGPIALRPHLRLRTVEHDASYVFAEDGVTALRGEHIAPLLGMLDGSRTLDELLSGRVPGLPGPDRVAGMIARLVDADLVASGPAGGRPAGPDETYWQACGLSGTGAAPSVDDDVLLRDLTGRLAREMGAALTGCGVGSAATDPDPAALTVVLCDDYLDERLADVDREQRRAGRPWLPVKPGGVQVSFGPFLGGGPASACWRCMADQMWPHRALERLAQDRTGRRGPVRLPDTSLPATRSIAINAAALEVARALRSGVCAAPSELRSLDTVRLDWHRHRVRRRPQCPACGDPSIVARTTARRPDLRRTATRPDHSWDRYRTLISPLTGVLKAVEPDERVPEAFHCYRSGPQLVSRVDDLDQMRQIAGIENGGKGTSARDGMTGALCEALERHSGTYHGDELIVRARYDEVADRALHPNEIQLYAGDQFRTRRRWNADHGAFQHVVEPFDTTATLSWTPLHSVTGDRTVLAPTALLYYGAPRGADHRFVRADSNGTAAGPTLRDATVSAALELVERDAVAIWWYNRLRRPAVDLDRMGDAWMDRVREVYDDERREVWAVDLTTDLGLPVVGVLSRRTGTDDEQIAFGFAADPDIRRATRRALAEMNQMMPALLGAARSDTHVTCADPDAQQWLRTARLDTHDHLRPSGPGGPLPDPEPGDSFDVVTSRLDRAGCELLVLDQTRPDVGLPVVRVLAPGLRHFWARFGPGRLFDVPVATGQRDTATAYADLNPEPMFL